MANTLPPHPKIQHDDQGNLWLNVGEYGQQIEVACFSSGGTRLLLDPFLTQDPATPPEFKDLSRYKPDAILVTHSHSDHDHPGYRHWRR